MTTPSPIKRDITSRACIKRLVDGFYERVQQDEMLGFIFTDVAQTDWAHHLPRMYDFWEAVRFRKGGFQGNPLAVHMALAQRTTMGRPQFERWLTLFQATVDELFEGPSAEHLKNIAADMATVIHRRIHDLPAPASMVRPTFSDHPGHAPLPSVAAAV